MKDTPTPTSTVRKAHRRIATVSTDRPGAALPVLAELDAESAASCDGASFWAARWHCQADFWQRSALFLDLLRQRAGDNNPWLAGEQAATRMISDAWMRIADGAMRRRRPCLPRCSPEERAMHDRGSRSPEAIVGGADNRVFGRLQ